MVFSREKTNVAIFAACEALFMTGATVFIIAGGLVGYALAEDKALATLPVSGGMIGTVAATIPASLLMKKIGRRWGFILGALIGASGALVAASGIFFEDFRLFALGAIVVGVYAGFAQYYRFAVTEVVNPGFQSRAISLVLAGGIVAALAGPELTEWSSELFPPNRFLGSFLVIAGLGLSAAILLLLLDIPPMREEEIRRPGRPLTRIMRQPAFIVAALVGMIGYGVTILMMVATPLAMTAYQHGLDHIALVVRWHTLAMFVPALFTGHLIRMLGVAPIMLLGLVLLGGCIVAALMGVEINQFWFGLAALGVGWNFTFIGASSLLIETYEPAEQAKVQAANDFLVFGSVAVASLLSGALLDRFDWQVVNTLAFPFLLAGGVAVLWLSMYRRAAFRHP